MYAMFVSRFTFRHTSAPEVKMDNRKKKAKESVPDNLVPLCPLDGSIRPNKPQSGYHWDFENHLSYAVLAQKTKISFNKVRLT
ncbi:MAG: hypothetical protein CSA33_08820 [Desulfobulbus propionicus]|nr:MAG: hypothetical protein CSA33_08820 [Desulfobulbus propionicus]